MLDDETSKRKRSTHKKGLLVVSLIDIILHEIMNTIKKKSVQFTLEIYQMMLKFKGPTVVSILWLFLDRRLDNNQLKELPTGVFDQNAQLRYL